ncbi:MAG: ABC transporter ATP-binding protein [Candidatus Aminicenantes bacterium]|nr:ABC transporter ATP-binding protein [Candidatus Aminicenantes bacterium]
MNKPIIELRDIYHCYPDSEWELSLSGLTIIPGEVVGIIGPNGSGKSTLLRIAAGVLSPIKGDVYLAGSDLKQMDRRTIARYMGYLPQELISVYDYTVEDIVRMGRYPYIKGFGAFKEPDQRAVIRSLERTDLTEFKHRRLSSLSGGEKKRVFLASVLAQEPDILLLDEPTSALDIHRQVYFFRLLRELASDGLGIGVVTHDLNMASLFSDRLILLFEGKCFRSGTPGEVLDSSVLKKVYGDGLLLNRHPESHRPAVLPRIGPEKSS